MQETIDKMMVSFFGWEKREILSNQIIFSYLLRFNIMK